MATSTTRLGLRKPDGSPGGDNIDVDQDISGSMDKIDDAVGAHVCTSGTRPTGAQRWDGRIIYETDTRRKYMWQNTLGFWMPLLIGRGNGIGPYLLNNSVDTSGEGINVSASAAAVATWRSRVNTETQPRHTVDVDGVHAWGPGSSTVVDTNLYRSAAGTLKTDGNLIVAGTLTGTTARMGVTLRRVLTNQTLPDNSATTVSWDTEDQDTDNMWASGTPTVITIPAGGTGLWSITFGVVLTASATARSLVYLILSAGTWTGAGAPFRNSFGAGEDACTVSGVIPLTAGNTFTCGAQVDMAGAASMVARLNAYKIGS